MTKTQCNKCMFSKPVSSQDPCEFHIPEKIKDTKTLSIVDDYYEIDNYRCLYGFGAEQYKKNIDSLNAVDLKAMIQEKASLKYCLLLDTRYISDEQFYALINEINNLSIKPDTCSIITHDNNPQIRYEHVKNNLFCKKWKLHVLVKDMSFNDSINIILDTGLTDVDFWCILFIEAHKQNKSLNSIVEQLQSTFIIKQSNFFGMKNKTLDLHNLCLNRIVYKSLVSTIGRNIIKSIQITPEIILQEYEV